jgi:protoporphyrinogen oxidase
MMRVAILGAGPAGLTAAFQLANAGVEVEVFEASGTVGGLARSFPLWGSGGRI